VALKEITAPKTEALRLQMSYEAFLQWVDEDTHAEWVEVKQAVLPVSQIFSLSTEKT
jgi:hypothetical protein